MLKIGHRGANEHEPENTIVAFQKAIDLGSDGIELDVHLSSDKEIIVIHDQTIDRTTNGTGFVHQMTLSELKKFRIHHNYEIPTLDEVFGILNHNILINIELKSFEAAAKVIALLEKYILQNKFTYQNFLISSFDWSALTFCHAQSPRISLGVLTDNSIESALIFAKEINAFAINPEFKLLNSKNIKEIHDHGLKIYAWTVNKVEDINKMKILKVDGIISDFPDRI